MGQGFGLFLSRISQGCMAATALFLLHSSAINVASAQTNENVSDRITEQTKKKTKEPVFRVSKLTDPANPGAAHGVLNRRNPNEDFRPNSSLQPRNVTAVPAKGNLNANATQPRAAVLPVVGNRHNRVADANSMPAVNNNIPTPNIASNALNASPSIAAPEKSAATVVPAAAAPHPLNRAIERAHTMLAKMRGEVFDYTAIMAKREQIKGVVGDQSYMELKVRCPRQVGHQQNPFSIYMKFLKPRETTGREVIWVDGQDESKLVVHEGSGLMKFRRFYLAPTSFLAMRGQRYPIYEAGLENLVVKLIEKAERDRAAGPCIVNYRDNGMILKRPCDVIEVIHKSRGPSYEFHKAQVFIDQELQLPVRYAAYDWPTTPGGESKLLEEYTYYKVKLNTGLTAMDFSPENTAYNFPKK